MAKTKKAAASDAETNTRTTAAAPEAAPTPAEERARTQALFDKADEDGKAEMIEAATKGLAVRGY